MSSQLSAEVASTSQIEIAARAPHAPNQGDACAAGGRTRGRKTRIRRGAVAIALGLSLASCGGAIATASELGTRVQLRPSTSRFEQQIRSLEARGYVQESCTLKGTAMYNPRMHNTVTVEP